MEIVYYPHPALRHKSKPIRRVNAELRKIVAQMFEYMYESEGIGLAANQVGLPLRLFVMNLKSDPQEGEPYVFINPVLSRPKGSIEKEEGCLSFPSLYAPVIRPEQITVTAFGLDGREMEAELDGLASRVVQHETDHLDGVVFIDRLSTTTKLSVQEELEAFEQEFDSRRQAGQIDDDEEIARHLAEMEDRFC